MLRALWFWSLASLLLFLLLVTGALSTPTLAGSAARTPPPLPPLCPLVSPTRVATPAFTPAPGCAATPRPGDLRATITDQPTTTDALFTNRSATCSYPIGLAVYQRFDPNIEHQQLYDYRLAVLPPHSTLVLTVNNPACAYQGDAFYGAHLTSFAGGARYGARRLDDTDGVNPTLCPHCATATASPTTTPPAPPTQTPTRLPQNTPTNTLTSTPPAPLTPTASATACLLAWHVVTSPNPSATENHLNDGAAISANDVWAVGYYDPGSIHQTLIEHWDGSAWTVVPSPNASTGVNELWGVAAVSGAPSGSDVWAVGYSASGGPTQTLVEHWNGTSWSVVPSPNLGTSQNALQDVAAVSANDIWAVGYAGSGGLQQTLVEHWNGTSWSIVPSPSPGTSESALYGVAAASANDVWAVGYYSNGYPTSARTLVEHWNGTSWSVVPSPSPRSLDNVLQHVVALTAGDVWAVGRSAGSYVFETLTEHWDGTNWSVVPSPIPGTNDNRFYGVAAVNAGNLWAVGYYDSVGAYQTMVQHWNGASWSVVASPNPGASADSLYGVTAVSASDVWAVGYSFDGRVYQTLIEHYAPLCPTTPSATPTSTPTNTPTSPPTN